MEKLGKSIKDAISGFLILTTQNGWNTELAFKTQYDLVFDEISEEDFLNAIQLKLKEIHHLNFRSIGVLDCANGSYNLTPVLEGGMYPILVNISKIEYDQVKEDKDKMTQLAKKKLIETNRQTNSMGN
jgi:hypothetical protein